MAQAIRVLVHDTKHSTSLLTHLGVKDTARLISTVPLLPAEDGVLFQFGMGMMRFGDGRPPLRAALGDGPHWWPVPVERWWTQIVHVFDGGATRITRRTMVLGAAHNEGGAHVDPNLTGAFKRLTEDAAFLHSARRVDGVDVSTPLHEVHFVNLRDMAFEITHSPDILVMASTVFPGPCDDCDGARREDAREPRLVRRTTLSATQCHELKCGHAWHVTAALEGGIGSPIIYPHACDCSLGEYDSRVFRLVGKRHPRFAAYAWGKYQAEGRGAIVIWEADVRKKLDIPDDIEVEPVYGFGYCGLNALEGADVPAWVKDSADRLVPVVREYDPNTSYVVLCRHLAAGVQPTVFRMKAIPPLPPDAYAARDRAWKESEPSQGGPPLR